MPYCCEIVAKKIGAEDWRPKDSFAGLPVGVHTGLTYITTAYILHLPTQLK